MNEFSRTLTCGNGLPLRGNDIDTDRIIPARYLKSISFAGLGDGVFIDERKDFTVNGKTHPFDDDRFSGANILVVGKITRKTFNQKNIKYLFVFYSK